MAKINKNIIIKIETTNIIHIKDVPLVEHHILERCIEHYKFNITSNHQKRKKKKKTKKKKRKGKAKKENELSTSVR